MRRLVAILRDPKSACDLAGEVWPELWSMARAEMMDGHVAVALADVAPSLPDAVAARVRERVAAADIARRQMLWEGQMIRHALRGVIDPVFLKGTAYAAADLGAADGRHIGDIDILVPRNQLDDVERALLADGWVHLKPDPYDQKYYRQWMHELPPMVHHERGTMIDVHHTILPLTARRRPDAAALWQDRVMTAHGAVLAPLDRLCHAAAHCLADGDLSGALRNLHDVHRLWADGVDHDALMRRAALHQLTEPVARALRLSHYFFGTQIGDGTDSGDDRGRLRGADRLFVARILARDGLGRARRPWLRRAFQLREHVMRMPPALLMRHALHKWRT